MLVSPRHQNSGMVLLLSFQFHLLQYIYLRQDLGFQWDGLADVTRTARFHLIAIIGGALGGRPLLGNCRYAACRIVAARRRRRLRHCGLRAGRIQVLGSRQTQARFGRRWRTRSGQYGDHQQLLRGQHTYPGQGMATSRWQHSPGRLRGCIVDTRNGLVSASTCIMLSVFNTASQQLSKTVDGPLRRVHGGCNRVWKTFLFHVFNHDFGVGNCPHIHAGQFHYQR